MQRIALFTRLTNRYQDYYRSLDAHRFLVDAKMTPPKLVVQPKDYADGGVTVSFVDVPAGADKKKAKAIVRALISKFSHWGCYHEYDCCGCELTSSTVKRVSRNRYLVKTRISYNY